MTWSLHPERKREVWQNQNGHEIAVYWDVNSERGIAFPADHDIEGEPFYVSRFQLISGNWREADKP